MDVGAAEEVEVDQEGAEEGDEGAASDVETYCSYWIRIWSFI